MSHFVPQRKQRGLIALILLTLASSTLPGYAGTGPRRIGPAAFIWDADHGMRDLTDLLLDEYGVDLGGSILVTANGVSADGTVIWGQKSPAGADGAGYWKLTLDEGAITYQPLTQFPVSVSGSIRFSLSAMSRDGNVFGGAMLDQSDGRWQAFIWSDQTGVVRLGQLAEGAFTRVTALSYDGTVAVGRAFAPSNHAFRWTQETGLIDLGDLPGGTDFSEATAVSDDGSIIIGHSSSGNSGTDDNRAEAFRWTQETGIQGLGDLPGGQFNSRATAISGDGSIIGGTVMGQTYQGAALFTDATGWVPFEPQPRENPPDVIKVINAFSTDAGFAVGSGEFPSTRAYLWEESQGFVSLGALPGYSPRSSALGVSDDGSIVVGSSNVPEPSTLSLVPLVASALSLRRGIRPFHSPAGPRTNTRRPRNQ